MGGLNGLIEPPSFPVLSAKSPENHGLSYINVGDLAEISS